MSVSEIVREWLNEYGVSEQVYETERIKILLLDIFY